MKALKLPSFEYKIKVEDQKTYIFDIIRKKFIFLTPEEWVRQHFVQFLLNQHHYPKSLIKIETGLNYNKLKKRSDIIVYSRSGAPFMLIECKSYEVKLSDSVFFQAATYNNKVGAPYLCVTNGLEHFVYQMPSIAHEGKFINTIPHFD